jgi:Arc/MetJ family transcription regulator
VQTNIVIDDDLMAEAMACTGLKTKKTVIEQALRILIRLKSQEEVRQLRGELSWAGDLDSQRQARLVDMDH